MTLLIALATGLVVGNLSIMRQVAGALLQGIFSILLVALFVG